MSEKSVDELSLMSFKELKKSAVKFYRDLERTLPCKKVRDARDGIGTLARENWLFLYDVVSQNPFLPELCSRSGGEIEICSNYSLWKDNGFGDGFARIAVNSNGVASLLVSSEKYNASLDWEETGSPGGILYNWGIAGANMDLIEKFAKMGRREIIGRLIRGTRKLS